MIPLLLLAAVIGAPAASPQPLPAPTTTSALPGIEAGMALPYPAYGSPQPQIVETRRDSRVPQVVTLDQATSIAVARAPSLAAARAAVDLQNAQVQLTRTGLAPNVSVSGSSVKSYQQAAASVSGLSNTASLSLSQLIFDGGQIRAKIDAANLNRDASVATYRRDAQAVAYAVATSYYQLLQDERAVSVDIELLRENVVSENLVRAQIRAGTVAGADLATQLALTAASRTTLVQAQGTLQNDRVVFATSLGLDADIDVLPSDDTQGLETQSPSLALPTFTSALAIAYAQRPDNQEATLTVKASQASLRSAQRGLSPSVSFSGSKGIGSASIGGGSFRNNASFGLDLTLPVYDQGITAANIASSRASVAQTTADAAATRLTVQRDVRQALIAIVSNVATLDQTRAAYTSGLASLRSTQGQYHVGVTTLPSLIQSETTLASAATNIVNAIYTLRLAQVNLRYALGTILQ